MSKKKPRKKMSAGVKMLIAAVLLLIAAAAQYVLVNRPGTGIGGQDMRLSETGKTVSYDFDANASFYSNDSRNFFFCTKDGMRYGASGDDIKWQDTFSLTKPIMAARGDSVAVADAKGRHVYVYNANGPTFDVAFEKPVLFFNINQSGYLSVILQLDTGYEVQVYHQRNGAAYLYANEIRGELYHPTATDVSEDGRFIMISMLNLNVRMASRTAFYYIKQQDAWYTPEGDGLFAGEDYPGELAYCVRFMDDNHALVFTDERIACYKPSEANTLNEVWSIPLHNKVDRLAFYGGKRFAWVTGDKLLNHDEADEPGMVYIHGVTDALPTGEFRLGMKATHLSMGLDSVIVGAGRSFNALNARGGRLWEHIAIQDTRAFIFLENTDAALMAGGNRADIMKRTRPKATPPPDEGLEGDYDGLEDEGAEDSDINTESTETEADS